MPGAGGASMLAAGHPPRSAGSPNVGGPVSPAASETQKQSRQNLVSRHNFTIIDIINIKSNKPLCTLPRREHCLQDVCVEVRDEFLSAVVIATGAVVYRQQLCNSRLHLGKCNSLHEASEQQRRPQIHGHGRGGRLSGTARAPCCNTPSSGALGAPQPPLHHHLWAQTHRKASPGCLLCLHSPQSVQSTLCRNNTDACCCLWK